MTNDAEVDGNSDGNSGDNKTGQKITSFQESKYIY